ncbi:uncharacterized protein N7484_004529 [Penicillium longicatenatum]|uniref:uncharacterized protein n=1 Tax=Penicillium longicatenatum TaxID=1561947 RepID=UPI0025484A04|nr:uncharacterized protein N7484_004529 [Penicillium longicatenatum]KAJ5650806.1 hypothetical protein N7484_004529 [Penicillium longicatenatum]
MKSWKASLRFNDIASGEIIRMIDLGPRLTARIAKTPDPVAPAVADHYATYPTQAKRMPSGA